MFLPSSAVIVAEILNNYSGIARNEASEMIGTDGTVIPGLYTASDASVNSAYMGFTITNAAAFVNWLCSFGLLLGKVLFCAKKGNRQERRELSYD